MAITRAQIARELYIKGGVVNPDGRRGFFKGAEKDSREKGSNISPGTVGGGPNIGSLRDDNPFTGGGDGPKGPPSIINKPPVKVPPPKPKETNVNKFKRAITKYGPYSYLDELTNSKLARFNNSLQRQDYIDSLDLDNPEEKEEYDRIMNQLGGLGMDIIAGPTDLENTTLSVPPSMLATDPMTQFKTVDGVSTLGDPGVSDVLGEGYEEYLDRFKTTDSGGGDDQVIDPCKGPNPPAYCFVGDDIEDTTVPRNLGGLAPRFAGSIFDFTGLADGGRAGYQQGGSIMPRLNDLGTDVSSAEQMLQEINQRLQSAESTLGEGGGDPSSGLIAIQPNNFNNFQPRQMPIGQPNNQFNVDPMSGPLQPAPRYASFGDMMSNRIQSDVPTSFTNLEGVRSNPDGTPYTPPQNNQLLSLMTNQSPGGALQSPLAGAIRQGAMDGGRMRQMEMMEDEDDPTGGIMDLESGRQMYFLGKLVKKAGRAIKKVVKSPIGKAALMYGLGSLGAGFLGKAQAGTGTGFFSGLKGKLFGTAAGKGYSMPGRGIFNKATEGLLGKLGITKGSGSMMPTLGGGISLGLGLPFALDALGVGKDKDEGFDLDEYYKTQGIDIDAIRNNPNRILARRFMAEGGDAEPVAKKTMPLLDMDGQEMDLRKEGGFVPLGRMERADDVPARLSKNEFVFTADAVRNAGEGDIDKGAEVMYNMMKNLESGGEVSEESQGLEGAREMFKTSQRLEEVL